MNNHKWISTEGGLSCELCKIKTFRSDGTDKEEPHKNQGMVMNLNLRVYYVLNDGNFTVVEVMPECAGEQPENLSGIEIIRNQDGSGLIKLI
jgi:hypothetical protein